MKLHSRIKASRPGNPVIVRITDKPFLHAHKREHEAFLCDTAWPAPDTTTGFAALITKNNTYPVADSDSLIVELPEDLHYLKAGDVVRINPNKNELHVLYRQDSSHNSFLLTERCNSNCIMCSQPPKPHDDSYIVDELVQAIPLIDPYTSVLGFTGGEPTLLGDDFFRLLSMTKNWLPHTELQVLSNGRAFSRLPFARRLANVGHPKLLLAIPLYSDLDDRHDFVVQAKGAFDETIRGMLNLARYHQRFEIRVVIHKQTYERLPALATFIARNLPFATHVALMGLENMGYVKMNLDALWIDPHDYQNELCESVRILDQTGIATSIYNHQLCVLDRSLWDFGRKSISDWKNIYIPECDNCQAKSQCGGFFASSGLRYSDYISPIDDLEASAPSW